MSLRILFYAKKNRELKRLGLPAVDLSFQSTRQSVGSKHSKGLAFLCVASAVGVLGIGGCAQVQQVANAAQDAFNIDRNGTGAPKSNQKTNSGATSETKYTSGSMRETKVDIAPAPAAKKGRDYLIPDTGNSVARIENVGSRTRVVFNGNAGPQYTAIKGLTLSPNGSRYAYIGENPSELSIVIDGKIAQTFSDKGLIPFMRLPLPRLASGSNESIALNTQATISGRAFLFSNDSKRVAFAIAKVKEGTNAYKAFKHNKYEEVHVYLNSERFLVVPRVGVMAFTPQNELIVMTSSDTGKNGQVYVGGKSGPNLIQISNFRIGANGEHYVYLGRSGRESDPMVWYRDNDVMLDFGQIPYADFGFNPRSVLFTPNLDHFAVVGSSSEATEEAIQNNRPGGSGKSKITGHTLFIDGKVIGDVDGNGMGDIKRSNVFLGTGGNWAALIDGRVVVNGVPGSGFKTLSNFVSSDDGKRYLYTASSQAGTFVVNEKGEEFRGSGYIGFSSDNKYSYIVLDIALGHSKYSRELYVNDKLIGTGPGLELLGFDLNRNILTVKNKMVDPKSASSSLLEVGLGLRVVQGNGPSYPVSPDGKYEAGFKSTYSSPGKPRITELLINKLPTGHTFDSILSGFTFDNNGVLNFLAVKGTDLIHCAYTP